MERESRIFRPRRPTSTARRTNLDPVTSHLVPALIRKVALAKQTGNRQVVVWGTGNLWRELLYSDDLAGGCIHLLNLPDPIYNRLLTRDYPPLVNAGTGADLTVREIAELVMSVLEFNRKVIFDRSRAYGTPRKLLDVGRINFLGWHAATNLEDGIRRTYESARHQFEVTEQ